MVAANRDAVDDDEMIEAYLLASSDGESGLVGTGVLTGVDMFGGEVASSRCSNY